MFQVDKEMPSTSATFEEEYFKCQLPFLKYAAFLEVPTFDVAVMLITCSVITLQDENYTQVCR
jgi:hypothetical protein